MRRVTSGVAAQGRRPPVHRPAVAALVVLVAGVVLLGASAGGVGATLLLHVAWPGGGERVHPGHPGHPVGPDHDPGAAVQTSTQVVGTADFQVGYDYTQNSHLADGGDPAAVAAAQGLLTTMGTFQNVFLMGWGAGDPEPTPGNYQWGSLDDLVEAMARTVPASQTMITLATAPGWMKVGGVSQEWNMQAAVDPSHFADFAQLAAAVALRYDGTHRDATGSLLPRVDSFDVWNELKGFWDDATNTWDVQGYTTMYNQVYAAIKAVRPDAQIGGPYAPLGAGPLLLTTPGAPEITGPFGTVDPRSLDAVTYWAQHMVGAQFLSVDGGPAVTDESGFASGQYFVAVADWLRALGAALGPAVSSLPIVWAEFYPGLQSESGTATGQEAVAIDVSNLAQAGQAGVANMLLWEMEGDAVGANPTTGESVWTDTSIDGGGQPTGLYQALSLLAAAFPPGTPLYGTSVTGPVTALAGQNGILVVNQTPDRLTVSVNGQALTLAPYAVEVA